MANNPEEVEERKQFILDWVKQNPLAESGSELVEALGKKYPHVTPGGHRGMIGRVLEGDRPWSREKTCPVEGCDTVAYGMTDALAKFGWRYKKTQLQSYCKDCRNRARREKRAERRAEREAAEAAETGQTNIEDAIEVKKVAS